MHSPETIARELQVLYPKEKNSSLTKDPRNTLRCIP